MKNISLIIITILCILSCGTSRKFSTSFFEKSSGKPQEIIDSIREKNLLPIFSPYKDWVKSMYYSSDSIITTQYVIVTSREDTTYIFSVTESAGDSLYLIKFRKE